MPSLSPSPRFRAFTAGSLTSAPLPLVAGRLWTYAAGTTTPKATFTDAGGLTENPNPIVLNARGEADVWLGTGSYKFVLTDAAGVPQGAAVDNIISMDQLQASLTALIAAGPSDLANSTDPAKGDALIAVKQPFTGAVATTQHKVNRRVVSVEDFGAVGDGSLTTTQMHAALTVAWTAALAGTFDLYFPPGTYDCGVNNFPFRNTVNTSLLDCGNLTIWCSGQRTILRTTSVEGADVLNLNALKNIHVRGFPLLTGTVTGSAAGTNGVSVTNGWDNITLEIYCLNLPYVDKTGTADSHIDGGKALTIQPGSGANLCGLLKATVIADGCAEGFGYEPDLSTAATKATVIDVDFIARNCYVGFKCVAAGASSALSVNMALGVTAYGHAVDCQYGVILQRAHGVDTDVQLSGNKTTAAKRLGPNGALWFAADTVVAGAVFQYAKNSYVRVTGNAGACDYKARIGGASPGSSSLNGATEYCDIYLDIGGTAAVSNIEGLDSGGNTMRDCILYVSKVTASSFPAAFALPGANNRLSLGANYSGTFTGTLTGCTTAPTGTIKYTINGEAVTLSIPDITGASNTAAATITGMPAFLWPAVGKSVIGVTTSNGTSAVARFSIRPDGVIELYVNATSGVFAVTGTKGAQNSDLLYLRP